MTLTPPADPQWRPCNGSYIYRYATIPARPHTGVSTGTYADYERNVSGFARTRGIGGWLMGLPYDPSGTWYVSTADDSSEVGIPGAPSVQHPPPGVK